MSDLLQSMLGPGITGGFYLAVMIGALIWFAGVVVAPKPLVLLIVCLTGAFTKASAGGLLSAAAFGLNVYDKGAGILFFSIIEISLLLLAVAAALRRAGGSNPLGKYYWMMFIVLLWHIMIGAIEGDQPWLANLSRGGIFYLLVQGLFVYALASYIATSEDVRKLMVLLGLTIGLRMVWGGFRYVFLGGDPLNAYNDDAADGSAPLRMTFWDINDSIYACMLGALLLWLAALADERPRWQRLAALLFGLYCFAIAALSARRTSQSGALLALVTLLVLLPKGRRWPVLLVFAMAAPLAVYKLQERMGSRESFAYHMTQGEGKSRFYVDPRYDRFHELRTAWKTIEKHPLLGVSPAGEFEVTDDTGLLYHKGYYGFVHSGFGHILLKTGAIGLLIFCSLLAAYGRTLVRAWSGASMWYRTVLVASACGFAAGVPNLAVGTPIIEARTMLVMGLLMALPLLVARARAQAEQSSISPVALSAHALTARVLAP